MPRPAAAPPPIRTDATNAFANNTMRTRVPETLQQVIDTNPDYPPSIRDALARLRDSLASDGPITMFAPGAPDYDDWQAMVAPHTNETWHNTGWFFGEVYTYRLIIEAVRWWETGRDPFLPMKQEEEAAADLWTMVEGALDAHAPDAPPDERLHHLLHSALWGNRIDLSFKWALERGTEVSDEDLLIDHSVAVVRQIMDGGGPVHLIADNYGRETAMDLVLADALLDTIQDQVFLHVKFHPTFISDTTAGDFHHLLRLAAGQRQPVSALSTRLQDALNAGRLRLVPDPYWNSVHFLWDLPPRLQALFAPARLAILKGDLNYRRTAGDAIWPEGRPFADAVAAFPAPLVMLRAMKSDVLVGLPVGTAARLDAQDDTWRWNGKHGLIQSNLA